MKRFRTLFWVAMVALVTRACVLEPVRMTDDSMSPVAVEGDVVLVQKLSYGIRVPGGGSLLWGWSTPQKGDLVVVSSVGDPPLSLMRRIASIPGEKVTLSDGKEVVLQDDQYFLRAEQSEGVMDSRQFGPILRRAIVGKATYLWLPKKTSAQNGSEVESKKSRILQVL